MEKLNWNQIEKDFNSKWIELVDYEWQDGKPFPDSGKVRVSASDRQEFYKLAKIDPPKDSAILFVGKPGVPENSFLCSSIMQFKNANN
jgi:hypothetical protein